MKMMVVAVFALTVMLSAVMKAQAFPDSVGCEYDLHSTMRIYDRLSDHLKFTHEQKQQLNILMEKHQGLAESEYKTLSKLREDTADLVSTGNLNKDKINELSEKSGRVIQNLTYQHLTFMAKFDNLLTEEQREKKNKKERKRLLRKSEYDKEYSPQ